jgi:histidyl-tRNA synthetase
MLKMEPAEFRAQAEAILTPSQREGGLYEKLMTVLSAKAITDLPEEARMHRSAQELERLLGMLREAGVRNARYDATLMRGFDYYTGIVFEIFDTNPENKRSMFGGGRYDGLVGLFGVEPVPTVGFAPGDVMLQEFLIAHGLLPQLKTETEVYVILIGDVFERAQAALKELREMGVNVAVDLSGRKLDKQIKTAEKKGIKYVLFIGESELVREQFKLKNLATGSETELSLPRIVTTIKDYREEL